jgi:hypothetical protein
MKKVEFYHGAITLEHEGEFGTISTLLKESDPVCTCKECNCGYNAAIDGLTSLILSLACEGVDVGTREFEKAVETTVDKIIDVFG